MYFYFFKFFPFIFIRWRLITLQYCTRAFTLATSVYMFNILRLTTFTLHINDSKQKDRMFYAYSEAVIDISLMLSQHY